MNSQDAVAPYHLFKNAQRFPERRVFLFIEEANMITGVSGAAPLLAPTTVAQDTTEKLCAQMFEPLRSG